MSFRPSKSDSLSMFVTMWLLITGIFLGLSINIIYEDIIKSWPGNWKLAIIASTIVQLLYLLWAYHEFYIKPLNKKKSKK